MRLISAALYHYSLRPRAVYNLNSSGLSSFFRALI
jgi:hypothetical protein